MKKILVTGGLGFIGSNLLIELKKKDCEVDVVDNLTNNCINPKDIDNGKIKKIYTCSLEQFEFPKKYDEIYHLASPVGPAGVLSYAGKMGKIIVNDALKIAEYASKNDSKVVFVSTSEIYGKDPEHETGQKEDINKIVPPNVTVRLEYGVGKMLMEICIINYSKFNPIKFNFIRPFNIVGVGQSAKAGFVVPRFVWQALHNEKITVFGTGKQIRTFTHVNDIVSAMNTIMETNLTGEAFNVGNPQNKYSIMDVAKSIKKMTNSKSEIICVDPKTIYGKHYEEAWNKIPDITKITTMTAWKPKYSFEDVVQEVIAYYTALMKEGKKPINFD